VKAGWRYHCCYKLGIKNDKRKSNRGKYRSAFATVDCVALNTVQWCDSGVIGFISADLAGND
jgi:hypothetical protein